MGSHLVTGDSSGYISVISLTMTDKGQSAKLMKVSEMLTYLRSSVNFNLI